MKKVKYFSRFVIRVVVPSLAIVGIGLCGLGVGGISLAEAAMYYVATNGNDSDSGTSAQPWATFSHAFSAMSGGDTLIIKDGIYNQQMKNPPSGTASNYTIVKAEHNWNVLIDGANFPDWTHTLEIYQRSYIQVEGIKFKANPARVNRQPASIPDSHHIKIFRCAFYDAPSTGNHSVMGIGPDSSYILVEECWAWGTGRYKFHIYQSDRVILRRCVSRHDKHNSGGYFPQATFDSYQSTNTLIQNSIAIDSDQEQYYLGGDFWGGFFFPHDRNTGGRIMGSIGLNLAGRAGVFGGDEIEGSHEVKDTVIWDSKGGITYNTMASPSLSINHVTVGNIWGTFGDVSYGGGTGAHSGFPNANINNSILYDCNSYGVADYINSDYNNFYSNTEDYGARYGVPPPSPGPNDRYVDPGLEYITRIEHDSPLKGAASDGGDIGANILYRYGVSGTLWGEPGYDQLTDQPLWPFPNEDEIKKDMASFVGPPSGQRGFAAYVSPFGSPDTLTSYIWEYLGNPIPPEIYGEPSILAITTTSLPDGTVGSYYSQAFTAQGGTPPYIWSIISGALPDGLSLASNGTISGVPTTAGTHSFTVRVQDSASPANTDTQDLSITVNTTPNNPPTASASANPTSGIAPLTVNFTGSGTDTDGVITFHSWDFGDGGTSTQQNPNHTYSNPGTYTATLTVTDDDGATGTDAVGITITSLGGTVYYVDPNGSDSNSGTQSQPWRTIQHAANTAQAGDTVLVNDGTYAGFHTVNSGTISNPITFRANGDNVVINSGNPNTADSINVEGTDYIVIDGFDVANSPRIGIRIVIARGVIIQNCTISNSQRFGILTGWTPEVQILNNISSNNGEHGIYVSNSDVPDDNPVVRGNYVSNNGENGIQLNGDNLEGGDGVITGGIIEDNIVHDNNWKGFSIISVANSIIRNNIVYNNGISAGAGGIHIVQQMNSTPDQMSNNNLVVNNTIVEPRIAAIRINADNINNVLFNNICISSEPIALEGTGNYVDITSNMQRSSSTGIFVNPSAGDYHLIANSPAINIGVASYHGSNAPNKDIEGNGRPQGSGYDIGAYEYPVQGIRGDVNGDGVVNIVDVQLAVNQFLGVLPQIQEADLNGDGVVNVLDVQLLVNIILSLAT